MLTRPPFRAIPGIVLALAVLVARAAGASAPAAFRVRVWAAISQRWAQGPGAAARCSDRPLPCARRFADSLCGCQGAVGSLREAWGSRSNLEVRSAGRSLPKPQVSASSSWLRLADSAMRAPRPSNAFVHWNALECPRWAQIWAQTQPREDFREGNLL